MAIGRISGSVLKSNLTRNGTDLAFETNLLYLDVTNSRVGIGTSEPSTALQVAGTVTATAFAGDGSNLTGINVDTNIQLVGDDSTGATLGTGETFKIAGGTNITTAVSGDTLTITGATPAVTAVNNATANELVTVGSTITELDGEANLTFDGSTLAVSGAQTITNTSTGDSLLITTTEDSSTAAPVITLKRNSSSPADADYLGQIKFKGENDADQEVVYAKITGKILDASDGTEDGILEFAHKKAGSNVITGRWRSDSLQLLNGTALTVDGQITGNLTGNVTGDVSGSSGSTTGNAATATALATARNIAGQSFDGSANITIASTDLSNTSAIALLTASQTLTNKTLTSPVIADITSTADIDLTATNDVNIPANVGLTFGDDGEKIEGDGTNLTISSSSNINLDASGGVNLDGGNGTINFKDDGTKFFVVSKSSTSAVLSVDATDGDMIFKGDDGGSVFTALTLDMSAAGTATFNHDVILPNDGILQFGDAGENIVGDGTDLTINSSGDVIMKLTGEQLKLNDGTSHIGQFDLTSNHLTIEVLGNDKDMFFKGWTGASQFTALTLDMSGSGAATFNSTIAATGLTINSAYTLPTADGSAGQVLTTDGSGTLSFTTVSVGDFTFNGSTMSAPSNADMTFDNSGTGRYIFEGTSSLAIPNGTTAQRPTGSTGEIRYNSSTDAIEGYTTSGGWAQLGATSSTSENTDDTATGTSTAISTTEKIINQFTTSGFDSAWYLTINRDEINDQVSTAKHSLAHNNSAAVVSSSHMTKSDTTNSFVTIDADVTSGNARLKATGTSVVNSLSFYRIALGDNTTAGTTGNVTNVINTDVDSASESIDSWAKGSYRAAKYYISINNASKTEVSNLEALVVHDGTTAFITSYGATNTGSNDLVNLTAAIDGSNVVVSATGNEPNLRVTAYRILLADDESGSTGDNVNVVAATTVSSTATTVDSFVNSAYTGAFYVFTGYNATEEAASAAEVMVVSNDEAYIAVGPTISTKGTDQLSFSATQSGSTVTVKAASTSGASTTVNGYRVHMLRGSAGASTADTVLVSTTQTISGAKTFSSPIALTVGSDPSTATNNAHIYAKDESSSAEVFVRDEAGNVTKISPHNEQGDWEYYSRNTKTGKTVRVNMEEMIRDIEKLTGKKYIKDF